MEAIQSIAASNFYSPTATEKAEKFINRVYSGDIKLDLLHNTNENHTGDREFRNYVMYTEFLSTYASNIILNI